MSEDELPAYRDKTSASGSKRPGQVKYTRSAIIMSLRLTNSQISWFSALAFFVGGIALSIFGYQNILASTIVIAALVGLWFSHNSPHQKLSTIGLIASIAGILFATSLNVIPYFSDIRTIDISSLTATNVTQYLFGVIIFFVMLLVYMIGLILLGISTLRSSSLPKGIGVLLILAGIVAVDSRIIGSFLTITGAIWIIRIKYPG